MRADLPILLPLIAGILVLLVRSNRVRRILLVAAAFSHLLLTISAWICPLAPVWHGWIAQDDLGLLFMTLASVLFAACSVYAAGNLAGARATARLDSEEGLLFNNQPEAVFTSCLLFFLSTMSLVCMARHFGLIWVAVEATTLSTAPLIYFHRHHRSLEAAWKYLMICSVGIAIALLGNFFIATAYEKTSAGGPDGVSLLIDNLLKASGPQVIWLKAGFVFLLAGYGTKIGLAPMHTWLPDAHSESPSLVSALLSGALLNCAFLAVLRAWQVLDAAGQTAFARPMMIALGMLSILVAAVFVIGQPDFKRLLAYSSVEHMGIIAVAIGLGGTALFGGLLHAVNHSLIKATLFLAAGNLLAVYRTKRCADVSGAVSTIPVTGMLWIAGFLAISGMPPFGMFLSKFTILREAFTSGHALLASVMLALLAVVFVAVTAPALRMAQGQPTANVAPVREPLWSYVPPVILCATTLVLGLHIPDALLRVLQGAAVLLGGAP